MTEDKDTRQTNIIVEEIRRTSVAFPDPFELTERIKCISVPRSRNVNTVNFSTYILVCAIDELIEDGVLTTEIRNAILYPCYSAQPDNSEATRIQEAIDQFGQEYPDHLRILVDTEKLKLAIRPIQVLKLSEQGIKERKKAEENLLNWKIKTRARDITTKLDNQSNRVLIFCWKEVKKRTDFSDQVLSG